jgi:hypothetical protein
MKDADMKLHGNARTCFHCRSLIVNRVINDNQTPASVAGDFQVAPRTVHKWVRRFQACGFDGLRDRSSWPHRIARRYLRSQAKNCTTQFFQCSIRHPARVESTERRGHWSIWQKSFEGTAQLRRTSISAVIKHAGCRWKKARIALTSTDPAYDEKVRVIRSTLAELKEDEAFFSIDEFGPFAVKMRGGKSLQGPKEVGSRVVV